MIERLTQDLSRASLEISLSLGNVGAFPDRKKPTVLWREIIDGRGELLQLKKYIDEALASLGLPMEKRPFRPHLTLARIRDKNPAPIPESLCLMPLTYPHAISIKEVSFFKSEPSSHGPRYTALYRIPLRKMGK